jgi:transposase
VKAEIVLESYRDGCSVADVARKHGVSGPQLHAWRRAAREGMLAMPEDDMLGLVPVVVEAGGGWRGGDHSTAPSDTIVLEIDGVRVIVPADFDADHLGQVITAIRAST